MTNGMRCSFTINPLFCDITNSFFDITKNNFWYHKENSIKLKLLYLLETCSCITEVIIRRSKKICWNSLKHDNVDTYASNFTDNVLELTNKHVPNKMIKIRQSDPSWLNNNIKRLLRKKKRLYDKYKHTNNINDFERYKQVRNKVTSEIRKSKSEEVKHLATKLEDTSIGQKEWWRTLKQFIKPEQTSGIPPLSLDDRIYSTEREKAEILNTHFTKQTFLTGTNATLPTAFIDPLLKQDRISTLLSEVESTLRAIKTGKAAGPDSINHIILKELAEPLSSPMSDLFNFSLASVKSQPHWNKPV